MMNEKEKGLEKMIRMLKHNKAEEILNEAAGRKYVHKKELKDIRDKVIKALEEGETFFCVDYRCDKNAAIRFFKKTEISGIFSNGQYRIYIDIKGLRKLNKELKKYNMEGF